MEPCDFGEYKSVKILELPIKVFTRVRCSIISNNHTVNVDHGHNVKHKHFSEYFVLLIFFKQLPDDSLHYIRRMRLARMDSG